MMHTSTHNDAGSFFRHVALLGTWHSGTGPISTQGHMQTMDTTTVASADEECMAYKRAVPMSSASRCQSRQMQSSQGSPACRHATIVNGRVHREQGGIIQAAPRVLYLAGRWQEKGNHVQRAACP